MSSLPLKRFVASTLIASLAAVATPAFATPVSTVTATLTGTVLGDDVRTPMAGVTVVVTDASGHRLASAPTGADGAFTVGGVVAGTSRIALATGEESFSIATPVVLAPGQTRGVRVALKSRQSDDDDDGSAAAPPADGGKGLGSMIAVLVGFVAASAVAVSQSDEDDTIPAASPSNPND